VVASCNKTIRTYVRRKKSVDICWFTYVHSLALRSSKNLDLLCYICSLLSAICLLLHLYPVPRSKVCQALPWRPYTYILRRCSGIKMFLLHNIINCLHWLHPVVLHIYIYCNVFYMSSIAAQRLQWKLLTSNSDKSNTNRPLRRSNRSNDVPLSNNGWNETRYWSIVQCYRCNGMGNGVPWHS
jgi:hypothetical protein